MSTSSANGDATSSASVSSISETASSATNSATVIITSSLASLPPRPTGPNNGGGGNNNNQFASPAASNLYLYTFLATLVLLLLVSGAVVARSITLRVRARRAIEESIRNGTYVPPPRSPNGVNAPKPVFYDAHLKDIDPRPIADEKHGHWNQLVPVAASFIPSKSPQALPHPATSTAPPPRPPLSTRIRNLNPFRAVQIQDILDEFASRDLHSRMAIQPDPQATQAQLAAAAFRASPVEGGNSDQQQDLERPSAMRVAVLIAMPDPSRPINNNNSSVHDDASSSTSPGKGKSPIAGNTAKSEDEAEMPYVEFGVAEVPFAPLVRQASSAPPSSPSPPSPQYRTN